MMIYLLLWYGLIGFTLAASLAGFLWGLKNGQFEDQQRVGFLPLRDMPPSTTVNEIGRSPRRTPELYALALCAILVLAAMAASLLLSMRNHAGGML